MFDPKKELEIGSVLEVEGTSVRIELSGELSELSRTYGGHVYGIGQIGSLIKVHYGRAILLAYVRMLRMQTDPDEDADRFVTADQDTRVLEADLFGEGIWHPRRHEFEFHRGVRTYPLPGQRAYLTTRDELEAVYSGAQRAQERMQDGPPPVIDLGTYYGASNAVCSLDVDRLFGHHCAVLGATGSGKSAAVAAVIHSLLAYDPGDDHSVRPRAIVIDPHGEYGTAFAGRAAVYRAYTSVDDDQEFRSLRLPYWLMNGEEFRDLVIGKTEFEATSENNIVRKALRHGRLVERGWIEQAVDWDGTDEDEIADPAAPRPVEEEVEDLVGSYNRDTPDPFSLDEFENHIRLEQGVGRKRGEWQTLSPSRFSSHQSVLDKLAVLRSDPRLSFMMRNYETRDPDLPQVLQQFVGDIEAEAADSPDIRIIDISGLPNEVAGPLTAAIARLLFEYKTWQTRGERERDPILFICEEAHRYVPNKGEAEYKAAQRAVRRIAKEGRKYGIGLMLVSQRPADVEETVLSQCNSWIVLRLANPTDQNFVKRFLPDSFSGLVEILSVLGRREAVVLGSAAAIPARIVIRELSTDELPDSMDIPFIRGWLEPPMSLEELTVVTQRWRNSGGGLNADEEQEHED